MRALCLAFQLTWTLKTKHFAKTVKLDLNMEDSTQTHYFVRKIETSKYLHAFLRTIYSESNKTVNFSWLVSVDVKREIAIKWACLKKMGKLAIITLGKQHETRRMRKGLLQFFNFVNKTV